MQLHNRDNTNSDIRDPSALAPEPHNSEIEAALLGALLTNNRSFDSVSDKLFPDHFYEPVHGRIYHAIALRLERGETVTPMVLMEFKEDPGLAQAGGMRYIFELAANVVSVINVRDYATTIIDLSLRRQLIVACREAITEAFNVSAEASASSVIETHEEAIYAATQHQTSTAIAPLSEAFEEMLDRLDKAMSRGDEIIGVRTGFREIDRLLGGLQPGKLITIGARPSMGKTALACNIFWKAGVAGFAGVLFSLEMEDYQLAARFGATEAGLSVADIDRGRIEPHQWQTLAGVMERAGTLDLYLETSGTIKVSQIRTAVRRLKRRRLDFVIVDYLGLLQPSRDAMRRGRVEQVQEITRELKQLAKDFDIPVVLLAQLNRDVERREDKRPMLADLRESGSVEQDSDTVIFLYRHEYYLERAEPKQSDREGDEAFEARFAQWGHELQKARGETEVIVAKNRQGPLRTIKLFFDVVSNKMSSLDEWHSDQDRMDL